VTTHNPFVGIYSAVTRKTVYGRQLGAEECISRQEALRAYTLDSAWVTFEDDIKGSIEPGKLADLAVLDAPDVTQWLYHLRPNACRRTVIGGETRWTA
jgi:predicted amidohydrolase YtcJ